MASKLNNPKIRRLLILIHLYLAAFMAPAFALLAISGFLYLLGDRGSAVRTDISLPAGVTLDAESPTLAADATALLAQAGIDYDISSIQAGRGGILATQPIIRDHYTFQITDGGVKAQKVEPNLQMTMIEVHKGHGPALLKTYHKLVAIGMLIVVFGGILVGLFAQAYRKPTIITTLVGTALYLLAILFL